ncbi:MAG TPA: hypothetical protein VIE40_08485, partial [Dehalococcoidia bacterium]
PFGPGWPVSPFGPGPPVSPFGPGSPVSPFGPGLPVSPFGPGTPDWFQTISVSPRLHDALAASMMRSVPLVR